MRLCVWHFPGFAKAEVEAGEAVSSHRISAAAFARKIVTEGTVSEVVGQLGQRIRKQLYKGPLGVGTFRGLGVRCSDRSRVSVQLPIRRIGATVADVHGKSAGPAADAGELPAADESIQRAVSVAR